MIRVPFSSQRGIDRVYLPSMLNSLRQTAPAVALLICVALLAMWLTGAHAHRPVGNHGHSHAQGLHAHAHHAHEDAAADDGSTGLPNVVLYAASTLLADAFSDIELTSLQPPHGKTLGDLPLIALLLCAALLLRRPRALIVAPPGNPPPLKRLEWFLSPPLRGPPDFAS